MNRVRLRSGFLCLAFIAAWLLLGVRQSSGDTIDDVTAKAKSSVVRITKFSRFGISHGSGFVIDGNGHIATNAHVAKNAATLSVLFSNGEVVESRVATVVALDAELDLAIIKVSRISAIPVTISTADLSGPRSVLAVGFPGRLDDDGQFVGMLSSFFGLPNPPNEVRFFWTLISELQKSDDPPADDEIVAAVKSKIAELSDEERADQVTRAYLAYTAQLENLGNILEDSDRPLDDTAASILNVSYTDGRVIKISERGWFGSDRRIPIIEHTAKISGGNSGGPLFNACGQIIGVNTQLISDDGVDSGSASSASVLATFCSSVPGLRISQTSAVCTADFSGGFAFSAIHLALFGVLLALVIVAIVLGLKRPALVTETYSQYQRRGSRYTPANTPAHDPSAAPGPRPTSPEKFSGDTQKVFTLEGSSPEGKSYRLRFTEKELKESGGRLMIGRMREVAHLHLDHDTVSRQHAVITRPEGKSSLYLEPRARENTTVVDGVAFTPEIAALKLKNGSEVRLGEVILKFHEIHG